MKDTEFWQLGQWGEAEVRRWLEHDCGLWVVPITCIENGGAPALTRLLQRRVLPDFQAWGNGDGGWWEVKTKTRIVWWQKTSEFRTGIEERLWNDYLTVEAETGRPGHLAMVHLEPKRLLLCARFRDLTPIPHTGSTDSFRGKRMVFFRVDDFDRVEVTATGPQLPPPRIEPKTVRPWEPGHVISERQPRLPLDGVG